MKMNTLFATLLVALSVPALASTIIGNPNTGVVLVAGPKTYVHAVVGSRCAGSPVTLPVEAVLSPNDSAGIVFPEDSYCAIVVRVKWSPGGPLVDVNVDGFDEFKALSGAGAVQIELDASTQTALLN